MTVKTLIEKNDNDMREEIQARFDAALEDGKDELDVYSEMLETGIDIKMVRKYLGDDAADHMKDFWVHYFQHKFYNLPQKKAAERRSFF